MKGKRIVFALTLFMGCHRLPNFSGHEVDAWTKKVSFDAARTMDLNSVGGDVYEAEVIADLEQAPTEQNPQSETVLLKLSVSPPTKATVMRGQKVMARLAPGTMDAEWSVPRYSGPFDLEIRADGYLTYHTRLYSDREDKIAVRLYRSTEAVGLWGYHPPSVGK